MSGSNDVYTMFRGSVKGTGYPLDSPVSPSLPPTVRRCVPSRFNWTLHTVLLPAYGQVKSTRNGWAAGFSQTTVHFYKAVTHWMTAVLIVT